MLRNPIECLEFERDKLGSEILTWEEGHNAYNMPKSYIDNLRKLADEYDEAIAALKEKKEMETYL